MTLFRRREFLVAVAGLAFAASTALNGPGSLDQSIDEWLLLTAK
jgi:hypothetical protein